MLLIPAIDLKDGHCVQLRQGVMASASTYSSDPAAMAKRWIDAGARRLHVVDLDGAFAGEPVNRRHVEAIAAVADDIPVQVGGGIREVETARAYLAVGVNQVIVGTAALDDADLLPALAAEFPGQTILGLDARDGRLATHGWQRARDVDVLRFAAELADIDLYAIVYTDIARDGMLAGVNAAATERLAAVANAPIIASGGVKDLDDLRALRSLGLPPSQLLGAISGSALYEGTLDFQAGQALLDA